MVVSSSYSRRGYGPGGGSAIVERNSFLHPDPYPDAKASCDVQGVVEVRSKAMRIVLLRGERGEIMRLLPSHALM